LTQTAPALNRNSSSESAAIRLQRRHAHWRADIARIMSIRAEVRAVRAAGVEEAADDDP
jgi:hypothetical protein